MQRIQKTKGSGAENNEMGESREEPELSQAGSSVMTGEGISEVVQHFPQVLFSRTQDHPVSVGVLQKRGPMMKVGYCGLHRFFSRLLQSPFMIAEGLSKRGVEE